MMKAIPTISKQAGGIIKVMFLAVIALLSFSFSFSWSGLIPAIASIGGMIVFLGLWIEKEADEEAKKENHLSESIRQKASLGWRILMIGIVVEIVTGSGIAAFDILKASQNDPLNRPIKSLDVQVNLVVVRKDKPMSNEQELALMGGEFDVFKKNGGKIATALCVSFDNTTKLVQLNGQNVDAALYSMSFKWPQAGVPHLRSDTDERDVLVKSFDMEVTNAVAMYPACKVPNVVLDGKCIVTINGNMQRTFQIPKTTDAPFIYNPPK